jgi:hypothetical protein
LGSTYRAHCKCGFEAEVTVGGGRHTFLEQSYFPYHCADCGLVSVNIAKMVQGPLPPCPNCHSPEFYPYGTSPVSIPIPKPTRWSLATEWVADRLGLEPGKASGTSVRSNRRAFQWGDWEANVYDNLCPACKQMTLVFDSMPLVMFD